MEQKSNSVPGKIGISLFLLVFALAGLFFMALMVSMLYQEASSYSWIETPCRIESGEIIKPRNSESKYDYKVEYKYVYNKRNYSSSRLSFNSTGGWYKDILKLSRTYPPGSDAKCYVNPSRPSEAALVRKLEWAMLPFMLIPLIFIAIGFGGIYFTWKKKKAEVSGNNPAVIPNPVASFKSAGRERYVLCTFFGIFLLVGILVGYFMFLQPVLKMQLAANWPQVPCEVESSRVVSHSGKSTTHSIEIIFRYQYKGVDYTGDKYNFIGGSSSGYEAKAKVVGNYPSGKKTFCYVNPEKPDEAVLSRALSSDLWFGLIPAIFALVGLGGIIGTLKYGKKTKEHVYELPFNRGDDYAREFNGPAGNVLRPTATPLKAFFGTVFFAVFWNGIVSIFVFQAVKSWGTNSVEWVLSIFIIPFVLVGLLMIFMVFWTLLQIFNPRPVLKLDPANPALGEQVSLSWEIPGYRSITRLEIKLEGYEEAIYNSGNGRRTDKNLFEQINIVNMDDPREINAGNVTFTMPRESMHSFDAASNKIIWRLKLHGSKKLFPDLSYEYDVRVLPGHQAKV